MKKLLLLTSLSASCMSTQAQTITNPGMESWRINVAGTGAGTKIITAPTGWYGADSLIIANGEIFGHIISPPIPDSAWHVQLFKDSTSVHGGTFAAKMVSMKQDTLGIFPGILSNAKTNLNINFSTLAYTLAYQGGTPVTYRPNTVSAWVKYTPGAAGDSAIFSVQVLGRHGAIIDSVMGTGTVAVGATSGYVQVTANVVYAIPDSIVDTMRITFASSKGGTASKVYSTLNVDDVTMTGIPFSVGELEAAGRLSKVFPNPAKNILNFDINANEPVTVKLVTTSGQEVASKGFAASSAGNIDISKLPDGLYFYSLVNTVGVTIQSGSVSVLK